MRHFPQYENFNNDVLTAKYHMSEPSEYFFKDAKTPNAFKKGLIKLDSSSSLSSHSSSEAESATSLKNNQPLGERRHKNFQVKKKTEYCKTFQLGLICPYGNKCSFAHGSDELRPKVLVPTNYKTVKCKQFFEKGFCNFGPRCQFLHEMPVYTESTVPSLSHTQLFQAVLNSIEKETPQQTPSYYHNYYGNQQQITTIEKCGAKRLAVFEGLNLY